MGMTEYEPINYEAAAPPHSREAEQSVLGAVLLDNQILDDLVGKIEPSDFYCPQHQAIYKTMLGMIGQSIDVITMSEEVKQHGEAGAVDLDYLVGLARNTPSTANATAYADIVVERSKERQLMGVGRLFSDLCNDKQLSHADRIEQAQIAFTALSSEKQAITQVDMKTLLQTTLDSLDRRFNGQEDGKQIKIGLAAIDERVQGFRAADYILVAARPSMGKTTYMTNVAMHVARQFGPVLIFSLEMTGVSLTERMIASTGRIHMKLVKNPKMSKEDPSFWSRLTAAVNLQKDLPIMIDDQGGLSVFELKARARRQHRKAPLSMVMIDYIGKLNDGSKSQSDNRNMEISRISSELKLLAKELECPVVALSQLNRSLENRPDKRPKLSDLRDSGSLEQDADIVQFLYRDEVYDEKSDSKGVLEIITAKFREGEIGTDRVLFEGQYNMISDMDHSRVVEMQRTKEAQSESKYKYPPN
jgi:replicative DNA helicase